MNKQIKHRKGALVLASAALVATAIATTGCKKSNTLDIRYQESSASTKKVVEFLKTKPYKYNTSEAGFPNYLATCRARVKETETVSPIPEPEQSLKNEDPVTEEGYLISSYNEEIKKLIDPKQANRQEVADAIKEYKDFKYIVVDTTSGYQTEYDFKTYYFVPTTNEYSRVIYFLHGGAYFKNISEKHLASCYDLANKLNAKVYMPLYPIGPLYDANDCFQFIDMLYQDIVTKEKGKEMIIAGDSAGGGLAISYSQFLYNRNLQKADEEKIPLPSARILFSPWCDLTMVNNEISSLEDKDVFLSSYGLREIGKIWAGAYDVKDYKISPKYGDLNDKIPTITFHGSDEILFPDSKATAEKMAANGARVRFVVGKGLFHIYPLFRTSPLILPESDKAFDMIYDFVVDKK